MRFNCSKCGKPLNAREDLAGKQTRCPACGTTIPVPEAGGVPPAAALPPSPAPVRSPLVPGISPPPPPPPPAPGGQAAPVAPPFPADAAFPNADAKDEMPVGFRRPRMGADPEARRKKAEQTKRFVKLGVLGVGVILLGLGARAMMTPSEDKPEKEKQPEITKKRTPTKKKGRKRARKKPPPPKPKPKPPAPTPAPTVTEKMPGPEETPEPGEAPPSPEETAQLNEIAALPRNGPAAVSPLVEALENPSWRVRSAAAKALGVTLPAVWTKAKRRNPRRRRVNKGWDVPLRKALMSEGAVPALAGACRDEDERVCEGAQKALLALYGFWVDPKEAVASGNAVACDVTFDLVEAGRIEGEKAAAFLCAALAGAEAAGRARAAKVLGGGEYGLALVVPALLKGVQDGDGELHAACASALRAAVGAKPEAAATMPKVRGVLLKTLEEEAAGPLAAEILEAAILARPETVAEIKNEAEYGEVLGFVKTRMRGKFIAALSKVIGVKIRSRIAEAATPEATDAEWSRFVTATLLRLGPLSGFALAPHLDPQVESEVTRGMIRERAGDALIRLGTDTLVSLHEVFKTGSDGRRAGAFGVLRAIVTDERYAKRRKAMAAAYREDRETAAAAGPAVGYLVAQLESEKPRVREDAARALELMGPAAKDAVGSLTRVLESDPASRKVEPGDGATPVFGETGPAKFPFVRAAAATALGEVGAAAKSAIPALEMALKDTHLRAAAFEALKKIRAAAASGTAAHGPKEVEAAWRVTLADGKVVEAAEVETYERATGTMVKIVRTDGMVLHLRKDEVKIERLAPGGEASSGADASRVAVRLKDGRTFDGRLLEETDEKIVIEYQRGSIKMRMTFMKADVKAITRGGAGMKKEGD